MAEDVEVGRGWSRFGFLWVHYLRMGKPVEREGRLAELEEAGGRAEAVLEWDEEELEVFHLYICWRLRMVADGARMYCVGVEKGDLRRAMRQAAERYFERFGRWPDGVVARKETVTEVQGEVMLVDGDGKQQATLQLERVERNWPVGVVGVYVRDRS